jgi:hypothetical protein
MRLQILLRWEIKLLAVDRGMMRHPHPLIITIILEEPSSTLVSRLPLCFPLEV